MADDDFDLDAMLDSALDEEFAATGTTGAAVAGKGEGAEGGGDELDLDAMLDEAIVSTSSGPDQGKRGDESKRASTEFGPSQQWLQRQQGRGNGSGTGAGVTGGRRDGVREPWPFLSADSRDVWKATFEEDAQRQADTDKQRPLSRAYRSFYAAPKEDGEIIVHLGSGATAAPSNSGGAEALQGKGVVAGAGGGDGKGAGGENGIAENIFEDVLSRGVALSGVKEPPSVEEGDCQALGRLKASYLRLVAKDVRARVSNDPDVSASRFPGIVSKILT